MIISPTVNNFLTCSPATDYTVNLPDIAVNLLSAKTVSTSTTIGGGSSISVWESSLEGKQFNFSLTLDRGRYLKLKKIKESSVDEFLWRMQGQIFEVVFDMPSAVRAPGYVEKWLCSLSLTIIKVV